MTNAEISLRVAKIMWPEFEWDYDVDGCGYVIALPSGDDFNYTTDESLGKMAVWYSSRPPVPCKTYDPVAKSQMLMVCLSSGNPHRALAEAIIEIGE